MEINQATVKTSHLASEALHHTTLTLFGHSFHAETVLVSFCMVLITFLFSLFLKNSIKLVPRRIQASAEIIFEYFADLACNMGGPKTRKYVPFILSFFIFILFSNLLGLLPPVLVIHGLVMTMPPTRDLNTTFALALVAFVTFQYIGYREHGFAYIKHYIHPLSDIINIFPKWAYFVLPFVAIFFIFLNLIEEGARVLSLTMRLMGNILGEHIVVGVLLGLVLLAVAMWGPVALLVDLLPVMMSFISLLASFLQAFVFTLLLTSYISAAINH